MQTGLLPCASAAPVAASADGYRYPLMDALTADVEGNRLVVGQVTEEAMARHLCLGPIGAGGALPSPGGRPAKSPAAREVAVLPARQLARSGRRSSQGQEPGRCKGEPVIYGFRDRLMGVFRAQAQAGWTQVYRTLGVVDTGRPRFLTVRSREGR